MEQVKKPNDDANVLAVMIAVPFVAAFVVAEGATLSLLWSWFMVPLSVPAISIAHGVGIIAMSSVFQSARKNRDEDNITIFIRKAAQLMIIIAVGYAAKQWM